MNTPTEADLKLALEIGRGPLCKHDLNVGPVVACPSCVAQALADVRQAERARYAGLVERTVKAGKAVLGNVHVVGCDGGFCSPKCDRLYNDLDAALAALEAR